MKKEYFQPRLKLTDAFIEQPMMVVSDLNVYDNPPINEDDYDNMLAKPTNLYDVWDDDKEKLDFHTEN